MYPVSQGFLDALRYAHTVIFRVDAYYNGNRILTDIPYTTGAVTINAGAGVRRTLDLTVADPDLWDELAPVGAELYPYRGIRFPDGREELVPLGVFSLDSQSVKVDKSDGITISSAPDRWARIQRSRFEVPETAVTSNTCVEEIARLLVGATPLTVKIQSTSSVKAGPLVWGRDRDTAITDLATAAGVEVFFDVLGTAVIRDVPVLTPPGVWSIDSGTTGVMLTGDAVRDRTRTYNVVVVTSSATDGSYPFDAVIIADDDPASVTYVGGPFGRVPYFYSSPIITDARDAQKAGRTLLSTLRGRYTQISAEGIVNPALDRGDTVGVLGVDRNVQLFVVDSTSVPLTVEGTQPISTRTLVEIPEEAS